MGLEGTAGERETAGEGALRCPKCGTVTWGQLNYCIECGEPLTVECPECAATWRYFFYYAYCSECGTKTGQKYHEAIHGGAGRGRR